MKIFQVAAQLFNADGQIG